MLSVVQSNHFREHSTAALVTGGGKPSLLMPKRNSRYRLETLSFEQYSPSLTLLDEEAISTLLSHVHGTSTIIAAGIAGMAGVVPALTVLAIGGLTAPKKKPHYYLSIVFNDGRQAVLKVCQKNLDRLSTYIDIDMSTQLMP